MDKSALLQQLYLRECQTKELVDIPHIPSGLVNLPEYQRWLDTKRNIEIEDVENTHWIKTCTGGYITELVFHSDGTLEEFRLFDRFETTGQWRLDDGVLLVEIQKGSNKYNLAVIGNSEINIHSAVELKNDELHSYLKLAQIK
ncbi:hypothetical protein ELS82_00165 [Vibrio ouci]|uniref:Uncharacterized protein n=2 Tax=Vibrio ouci TaxID=2499078 RepID=A0A4Y8WL50_9VIBR|nr:hypothetical protein [Vibrio ouci]TFH93690.1 hypothetical protein ELS82_00165 [Vibrio ouci]